jgi:ABC-type nitrate/sulfonate/bicarbonate transport system substrate-binding protein
MNPMDRRRFLRIMGASAALPLAGGLAACGGSSSGSGGSSNKVGKLKLAISSTPLDTYLVQIAGPLLYGKDFGLHMTKDDILIFQSHATAVQAALSGKVNAVGASTMANMAAIAQGTPFKLFQPYSLVDDYVIASTGSIDSLGTVKSKNAVIGIDSEGGAARTAMDAMLTAKNAGYVVGDLQHIQDIESSGERQSALASSQVQVTVIHKAQADQVKQQGKTVHELATLYESAPNYLKESYAAPKAWLDENLATATALSASIIKASRELRASEDAFISAVKKLIDEPPSDQELKGAYALIKQYDFWPAKVTGLEKNRLDFMINLGITEKILNKGAVTADKVVDMRPVNAALKKLGNG